MNPGNFHTHTYYCDGSNDPLAYVEEAIKLGYGALGFSSHAPVPFHCKWTMPDDKYENYTNSIENLKSVYSNEIEIYCGLEIDFIPDLLEYTKEFIHKKKLDYIIGSIHFIDQFDNGHQWAIDGSKEEFKKGLDEIFYGDYHEVIRRYFKYTRLMVKNMKPDIIGHIDKLKMQFPNEIIIPENDAVYKNEIYNTLEEIALSGCIVEINTRGVYKRREKEFYPGSWIIKEMSRLNIPVIISSDAHRPAELSGLFPEAVNELKKAGYKSLLTRKNNNWISLDINDITN